MITKEFKGQKLCNSIWALVAYKADTGHDLFEDAASLKEGASGLFIVNAYGAFRRAWRKTAGEPDKQSCTEVANEELDIADIANPELVGIIASLISGKPGQTTQQEAVGGPKSEG